MISPPSEAEEGQQGGLVRCKTTYVNIKIMLFLSCKPLPWKKRVSGSKCTVSPGKNWRRMYETSSSIEQISYLFHNALHIRTCFQTFILLWPPTPEYCILFFDHFNGPYLGALTHLCPCSTTRNILFWTPPLETKNLS